MEILAIIPARGGSKGLPGKNIRPLLNHPLLAYSILAAQHAKLITRIIVNTDSEEIAAAAKKYGAEVFMRPAELGNDDTTDIEVFQHQLNELRERENYIPELVIQLRPTSPVRFENMIDDCIGKLLRSDADSLRIITESPMTPYKMWILDDIFMKPLLMNENIPEPYNQPRQKLPVIYWQVGTLDVIRAKVITGKKSMNGDKIIPQIIDRKYAIDIDDIISFQKAEQLIQHTHCIKFDV